MAEYDLIIKALSERYMSHIATLVRGVKVHVEQIEPTDKETVAVQRTSDVLYKIKEDGYEYIMLVEFQTRPDRNMATRLLEYTVMHHRRYNNKPIYPVVINLTGKGGQDNHYSFDCVDITVINFHYHQINLQDITGRDFLYRGPVGLLPLTPLMRQDDQPEQVLQKCADRLEKEVPRQDDRATLYLALGVMAALKFPKDLITKVLEVSKMENSPLFDGIREEWEAKGIAKGMAKGKLEGKLEGRTDTLFDVLEVKFGQVPDNIHDQLLEFKDPEIIKDIVRKAINAKTIEEFAKLLKN